MSPIDTVRVPQSVTSTTVTSLCLANPSDYAWFRVFDQPPSKSKIVCWAATPEGVVGLIDDGRVLSPACDFAGFIAYGNATGYIDA